MEKTINWISILSLDLVIVQVVELENQQNWTVLVNASNAPKYVKHACFHCLHMSSNVNDNPDIYKRYIKTMFIHLVYVKRRALGSEAT